MSKLRNLFHSPQPKEIGGVSFLFYKVAFDQFDDAITLGEWLGADAFSIEKLRTAAKPGSPQRELLLKLVAGCIKLPDQEDFLQSADVAVMPVPMLAEVLMHILEENADFFIQTLPSLTQAMVRLGSIGSELLNSSSAPAITPTASPATP